MRYLLTTLTTAVILVLIMLPASTLPDMGTFSGLDKVAHFLLFFGWSLAVQNDFDFRLKWWWILIMGTGLSVLTEVIQIGIDGRSYDVNDMIADVAGLIFGLANGRFFVKLMRRILPFVHRRS